MGIKVTLNTVGGSRVSINGLNKETVRTVGIGPPSHVSINTINKDTIRTVGIGLRSGATKLSELSDVDASDPDNGEVLVYDENSQNYIIKTLPVVNGGTF